MPRRQLPLMVDGPQALPVGPGMFLLLSACAIALGDFPPAYSLKTWETIAASFSLTRRRRARVRRVARASHYVVAKQLPPPDFPARTRPLCPRHVFSPRLLRYRALIVPVKPMWSSAISPSDNV